MVFWKPGARFRCFSVFYGALLRNKLNRGLWLSQRSYLGFDPNLLVYFLSGNPD